VKNILIICYSFPPFPGVGGRRWAKFAKYLAQKETYGIHVLCAQNPFEEESIWTKDVTHKNIKIHPLPVNYPRVMYKGTNSLFDKILYRLWKLYFSFRSNGVVFEKTMFWEKQLLKKASELIEQEGIKNVIVSIPPYRLASYSIKLKEKHPGINLIVDYRDPWTDNKSFHGFKDISPSRFAYEQNMEAKVIKGANMVVSVSDAMTRELKSRNIEPDKIITIPNGYDPAEILPSAQKEANGNKLKFIYAGTLYNDLEYVVLPLITYLDKLGKTNPELYNRISFEFYGNLNKELKEKLSSSGNVVIHKPVPLAEMQEILSNCSFCVLITPPDYTVVFNTKFCEYLANRKPVLLFTYPCDASDFLVKNKLGFHIDPAHIEKGLDRLFNNVEDIITGFNAGFDIEPFNVIYLTSQVEKILK